jgi:hypothetical protein
VTLTFAMFPGVEAVRTAVGSARSDTRRLPGVLVGQAVREGDGTSEEGDAGGPAAGTGLFSDDGLRSGRRIAWHSPDRNSDRWVAD